MFLKEKINRLFYYLGIRITNPSRFFSFLVIAIIGTIVIAYINQRVPWVTPAFLFIALLIIILFTSGLAGHAVIKSLF